MCIVIEELVRRIVLPDPMEPIESSNRADRQGSGCGVNEFQVYPSQESESCDVTESYIRGLLGPRIIVHKFDFRRHIELSTVIST